MSWPKAQVKMLKWSKGSVEMLMREVDPQLVMGRSKCFMGRWDLNIDEG